MKIIGGELVPQTKSHSWDMDAGAVLPALFEIQDKSLQAVIDSIYRIYGSVISEGYTIWGDTTPLNTYYLPEIYSLFPDAKYIFLIRDGRDVVASYKKGGEAHMGNLANPVASMHYWQDSINQYDWLKKRTKVVTVKYEMLVQNPEEELARVCDHLGINFEAGMLQFFAQDQLPGFYDEPHHANLRRAVFTGSVGNWKTALTEPERLQMSVLDEHLKRFGYH